LRVNTREAEWDNDDDDCHSGDEMDNRDPHVTRSITDGLRAG
jgi:hypothetical protein